MLEHADTEHLNFGTTPIQRSNLIKYLGGYLDSCLTFEEHVKQKCKAAMLNFIKIKAIRPSLTASACHTLVLMLCISHLDYANALLYGMTKKLKSKYQRIQNVCQTGSKQEKIQQCHKMPPGAALAPHGTENTTQNTAIDPPGTIWSSPQVHTGNDKDQDNLQTVKIWSFRKTLVHTKHTETNICLKVIQLCCSSTMEPPTAAP